MSVKIVITGGLGFIGSHLVRWILTHQPPVEIINVDALTYAGNLANLAEYADDPRYQWQRVSITDRPGLDQVFQAHGPIDAVIHLAAESHVDRSIQSGVPFVHTNVLGTQTLLEVARSHGVGRFLHVSTDEVYGTLKESGYFREETPLAPNSPYSASKAGSDLLARAAFETYGQDVVITRCSNNYGPYQFPEKMLPLFITNGLDGKPWPLYGDGLHVRDWLYVEDHVRALWSVLDRGRAGEIYNIGGHNERSNREVADALAGLMDLPKSVIVTVADRPGHDRRYAIDSRKIQTELGWRPETPWDQGLARTVDWYRSHREWWEGIKDGRYQEYYRKQYGTLS